jgi:hypothetical protein
MTRLLHAIFCDDVRLEAGNKLSYMGCYTGQMVVASFPTVLPKICVVMTASTPRSKPFKELKFVLFNNDDVVAEQVQSIPSAIEIPLGMEGEEMRLMAAQVIQIFPFQLTAPCKLRARAFTEDGELKGGSLLVTDTAHQQLRNV